MPNWNWNTVKIGAPELQVREYLTIHENRLYFNMHKLFPERFPGTDPAGFDNWDYEWACTNTGSKWFPELCICSEPNDEVTVLDYESAWTPNNGTLQRLHDLTGRTIENTYEESGMQVAGTFHCDRGHYEDIETEYLSPCEICEIGKPEGEFDDEADDHICNACREKSKLTS